jgi:hypothetical protein
MTFRRAPRVLVLIALLTLSLGCSSYRTLPVDTDFTKMPSINAADKPVRITAFTDADGTDQEWKGYVWASATDSLEFYKGSASGERKSEWFRVARADVASLEMVESTDPTTGIVVAGTLLSLIPLIYALAGGGY